ncbi:hypothetical protein [Mailhella massiliensis]|uniref:Uncharacterized protein n=1 Tax=Mailhella massiliensis TaxID=1903261 RepID=A0A921AUZ8_9BACT|nr:hypothetical protein [Mailhella massiliensis]HJD96566.1 hypothetical protein [Mailhella massiliensis]
MCHRIRIGKNRQVRIASLCKWEEKGKDYGTEKGRFMEKVGQVSKGACFFHEERDIFP